MIVTDYLCPLHGHFEATVEAPSPDEMPCPGEVHMHGEGAPDVEHTPAELAAMEAGGLTARCGLSSPWSPTAMHGKVKAWEVERGGWEKPERQSFLDTRELGEGQDIQDFREKRSAIRDQERKAAVMEMLK